MDARSERQQALKERLEDEWDPQFLTLDDCARMMKVCRTTAWKIFRHEPDVERWHTPGSRRPIIRVPRVVLERLMRRSANPYRRA
jgi:hypothetical protein